MSMDAATIRRYAADPMAFISDLTLQAGAGPRRFGDVMAGFQRDRFEALCPSLLAVARGAEPPIGRYWFEATKGASKDSDLAAALLWLVAFSGRPLACQVGAADADQADELRKAAKTWVHFNPWLSERVQVQATRIACSATGSSAEIIAADVAGSHGARPDVLILNELSHVTKTEFAQNLLDNAAKVPNGLVVIATNAGVLQSWQWAWRELARTSARWFFHVWNKPAPWLRPEEIEEAKVRNPQSRYLRLWWGRWSTAGEGDALDPDDVAWALDQLPGPLMGYSQYHGPFIAGLDLGIRHDRSALVILGQDIARQRVRLVMAKSWTPKDFGGKVSLDVVKAEVIELAKAFQLEALIADPWQASLMLEHVRQAGFLAVECPPTGPNLSVMAKCLLDTFRNKRLIAYRDDELAADLACLSIVERPGGAGFKLTAVRDNRGHCDLAFALACVLPHAIEFNKVLCQEAYFPNQNQYQRLPAVLG